MNCIIIDDEPIARKGIENLIKKIPFLDLVGICKQPGEIEEIMKKEKVDLLFLDIEMPEMTGIEFLKNKQAPITIITTAFPNYALQSYELDVLDYLVKPIPFERFYQACKKAYDYYELKELAKKNNTNLSDYFFIKCDSKLEKIVFDEILFIESKVNYVLIHTTTRRYMTYITMKSVEEYLPENLFLKVHKSFIVSTTKIESIDGAEIVIGKHRIPISRNQKNEIVEKLLNNRLLKR